MLRWGGRLRGVGRLIRRRRFPHNRSYRADGKIVAACPGSLKHDTEGRLHAAGVGAVRETLRSVAEAESKGRLDDAARSAISLSVDAGVVLRVEYVEGFEHQIGF